MKAERAKVIAQMAFERRPARLSVGRSETLQSAEANRRSRLRNRTVCGTFFAWAEQPDKTPGKTPLVFYRGAGVKEPVRDWLKGLAAADRLAVGQDLMRAQWRWPVGMPLCRALGQGLWEVRTELPSGRIARVLICPDDGVLVALHGFSKKTQKKPDDELALARKRMKELKS